MALRLPFEAKAKLADAAWEVAQLVYNYDDAARVFLSMLQHHIEALKATNEGGEQQ